MQGRALFIVRAEVADAADRAAFDRWYAEEHLPDAVKAFRPARAWRGWSHAEPAVHYAFYEFESLDRLRRATAPETLKDLIAEFDRVWGDRVRRTRDMVEIVGALAPEAQ